MIASPARRRTSRLIAAVGFLAFPYCIALGQWTPGHPELDDLRRWRVVPLFWLALLVPWLGVGVAAPLIGAPAAFGALYAAALAIVAVRLQRRHGSGGEVVVTLVADDTASGA